jgi:hypothetical protein
MRVLGLAGPAGSGKTTIAGILVRDWGFKELSFAKPLKAALAAMGLPEPATQELKEAIIPWLGVSWRHCAQTLGTEWGRKLVNPNLWVLATMQNLNPRCNYVFSDVRFENESKAIREIGGNVVHIKGRAHDMAEGTKTHASEAGIANTIGDYVINNAGGSLDSLRAHNIPDLMRLLRIRPFPDQPSNYNPAFGAGMPEAS